MAGFGHAVRHNGARLDRRHPEDDEQRALFTWAGLQQLSDPPDPTHRKLSDYLIHIPNGGRRGRTEAARLKGLGVKAGVSDLLLPIVVGCFAGLWIEMKARGGKPTRDQVEWLERMDRCGYATAVAEGFDEARGIILRYLSGQVQPGEMV